MAQHGHLACENHDLVTPMLKRSLLVAVVVAFVLVSGFFILQGQSSSSARASTSDLASSISTSESSSSARASTSDLASSISTESGASTSSRLSQSVSTSSVSLEDTTIQFSTIQNDFTMGGYSFRLLCNGDYCQTTSGTVTSVNLGSTVLFNITIGSESQTLEFGWAPNQSPTVVPVPQQASAFNGAVTMTWFTNSTGLYLSITVEH